MAIITLITTGKNNSILIGSFFFACMEMPARFFENEASAGKGKLRLPKGRFEVSTSVRVPPAKFYFYYESKLL